VNVTGKMEIVDAVNDEDRRVLAAPLAQHPINRLMERARDPGEAAEQLALLEPEDVSEDTAVGETAQVDAVAIDSNIHS
jgi:hypothetical protein